MKRTPHRIRRQTWLVKTTSEEQAFAVNRRLRENLEPVLLPALCTAFDEVSSDDAVVHVPKLEMHVRIEDIDEVTRSLPDLLRQAARERLRRTAPASRAPDAAVGAVERSTAGGSRETVSEYLETGLAPWWTIQPGRDETLAVLRAGVSPGWNVVVARWRNEPLQPLERGQRFFRLLQLVSKQEWTAIAAAVGAELGPQARAAFWRAIAVLAGSGAGKAERGQTFDAVRLAAVVLAVAQASHATTDLIEFARIGDVVVPTAGPPAGVTQGLAAVIEFLATVRAQPGAGAAAGATPAPSAATSELVPRRTVLEAAAAPSDSRTGIRKASPGTRPQREAATFALPVAHAGLILLHPFLPALFRNAEIDTAEPRAAALLYLVATGREDPYEFELGLIKVLLGMKVDTPLIVGPVLLNDHDREEADALLRAVLLHWTALKHTSVDGLRTGFLQRGGLLREETDGWRLQIQREPFDVLLDHLPWEISTVALPWLSQPIFTTW